MVAEETNRDISLLIVRPLAPVLAWVAATPRAQVMTDCRDSRQVYLGNMWRFLAWFVVGLTLAVAGLVAEYLSVDRSVPVPYGPILLAAIPCGLLAMLYIARAGVPWYSYAWADRLHVVLRPRTADVVVVVVGYCVVVWWLS